MAVDVVSVTASDRDAHENDSGTDYNATAALLRLDSQTTSNGRYDGGMLFTPGVNLVGATINAGTFVSLEFNNTSSDDPNWDIHCEDADNPVDFTASATVTGRTPTTASTAWAVDGVGAGVVNSPDIDGAVGEAVGRPGYANGNNVMVLTLGRSDAAKISRVAAEDNSTKAAPQLTIEYTPAAAGGPPAGSLALSGVGI